MTILHITSEFSKKNFSISSLIIYISNYLHINFKINFSILVSHYEKDLFESKNTETLKFSNFFDFFFKIRLLKNKISKYKIVHIHGGEVTFGAFDDSLRHSISKLSNYHFVSHAKYKRRLIQLGENKKKIFVTGALGAENFYKTVKLKRKDIIEKYNLNKNFKIALITFHPEFF